MGKAASGHPTAGEQQHLHQKLAEGKSNAISCIAIRREKRASDAVPDVGLVLTT